MKPHVQVTLVMRASNLLYVYAHMYQRIHARRPVLYVFYVLQYMNGHADSNSCRAEHFISSPINFYPVNLHHCRCKHVFSIRV